MSCYAACVAWLHWSTAILGMTGMACQHKLQVCSMNLSFPVEKVYAPADHGSVGADMVVAGSLFGAVS